LASATSRLSLLGYKSDPQSCNN